jgi:2-polyprenyl-6-methoxyphenol hydroxylase-like FAD-dependent oxidoreductase
VQVLVEAMPVEALHAGCPLETILVDGDVLVVRHPAGTVRADLVVGADGINSAVRRQWWPAAPPPRYVGSAAWRMITRAPPGSIGDGAVYWGRGERIGFTAMPGGRHYLFAAPAVVVHWSIGHTDLLHLGPMYAAIGVTAVALCLAHAYLCARPSPVHAAARERIALS